MIWEPDMIRDTGLPTRNARLQGDNPAYACNCLGPVYSRKKQLGLLVFPLV